MTDPEKFAHRIAALREEARIKWNTGNPIEPVSVNSWELLGIIDELHRLQQGNERVGPYLLARDRFDESVKLVASYKSNLPFGAQTVFERRLAELVERHDAAIRAAKCL